MWVVRFNWVVKLKSANSKTRIFHFLPPLTVARLPRPILLEFLELLLFGDSRSFYLTSSLILFSKFIYSISWSLISVTTLSSSSFFFFSKSATKLSKLGSSSDYSSKPTIVCPLPPNFLGFFGFFLIANVWSLARGEKSKIFILTAFLSWFSCIAAYLIYNRSSNWSLSYIWLAMRISSFLK